MKKLLALAIALCLFCTSFAFAEAITSNGDPLQLDDFTLNLADGMVYIPGTKETNQVLILLYPYASAGDTATNINFVPLGTNLDFTTATVAASAEASKATIKETLEAQGFTLDSVEFSDAVETSLGGAPCVSIDNTMDITYLSISMTIYQRELYVSGKGYMITVSASDKEMLDPLMELLDAMLIWN